MSHQMGIKFFNAVESRIQEDVMEATALRADVISIYTEST